LAVLSLAMSGCHLIDQTDFDRRLITKAPPPVPDPETRAALVTIDYTTANPDYTAALAEAIHVVETRRPGVLYDVVAVVPSAAEAPSGRNRAAEVMTGIEASGVAPARVRLGLRLDPGRKTQRVRVYLE
jgi:hypothetical protein